MSIKRKKGFFWTHLFSCGPLVELSSSCWNINLVALFSLEILLFFLTTLSSPLMSSKLICSYLLDFFIFWTTLLNTDGSSARSSWKKVGKWMNESYFCWIWLWGELCSVPSIQQFGHVLLKNPLLLSFLWNLLNPFKTLAG